MSKTTKIIAAVLVALCLVFLSGLAAARWFVKSGRLQKLIETRAAEATGANVRVKSIRLSWPLKLDVEGLVVSVPGREESVLFSCQRIGITAMLGNLMRGRLGSVVLVEPRVNLVESTLDKLSGPRSDAGSGAGKSFSVGTVKIINGEINLDLPTVKANLRGILATLSRPLLSAGDEHVLKLNIDGGDVSIGQENKELIPVALKLVQSKVVFRRKQLGSEVEATVNSLVTAEVPYMLLPPDIPISVSFELDYFPQRDAIENGIFSFTIPQLESVSVYGSVTGLTSGTPSPNLNVTIQAPEVADLLEYCSLLQRPSYEDIKMAGALSISGEVKGSIEEPELSLRASTGNGRFEWKGIVLDGVSVEMPVSIRVDGFDAGPGRIKANKALIPLGGEKLEMASLSGLLAADTSRVTASQFEAKLGSAGTLSVEGACEFDSGVLRGKVRMADASAAGLLAYASPAVYKLPDNFEADGKLEVNGDIEAQLASPLEKVKVRYDVSLTDGEFSSGEFISAAGLKAKLSGNIETEALAELWRFDADAEVGNFEILVDIFYKNFSENRFPLSLSGEYLVDAKRLRNATASVDLGRIGKITAQGGARFASKPEITMELRTERIDLEELYKEAGQELLSEISPFLGEVEIAGLASGDFTVRFEGERWETGGTLELVDGRFALSQDDFATGSISAHLPFDIYFPEKEQADPVRFTPEDYGRISFSNVDVGPVNIDSLILDVALKKNSLSVKGPISLDIFEGALNIGEIHGEALLGTSARVMTSLFVESIDVGHASESLGLPRIAGVLNAQIPKITLSGDSLTTEGGATANVFGGTVDTTSIRVSNPFSPVRTYRANLEFKEIDLLSVTKVLDFGSITGIMEGTVKGLAISQGQPAAFVADFETVKRKGIPRKINFDAVENITILGTGRGFQAGVGRGLATFFEEFGYQKIGFYCSLKNDNFRMKGKVISNDTEYFVKGIRLGPSINVINRNPGQIVSFKSMVERVNRIGTTQTPDEE